MARLKKEFPKLTFRYRSDLSKREINEALQKIDKGLGQTLFVSNARIKPDGGIIEVKDDNGRWRVIVVSEAKYQGKDIENIKSGKLVGKNNDQVLMAAGNAIERAHKDVCEIANFMLTESHFPYRQHRIIQREHSARDFLSGQGLKSAGILCVFQTFQTAGSAKNIRRRRKVQLCGVAYILFLEGSNFLTQNISIERPDGSIYTMAYNDGTLNRLDRLTAANYGMPINTNLCENKFVSGNGLSIMLQAASIYTQGDGEHWKDEDMVNIMLDVARTSLRMLSKDLFNQLTAE